MLLLVFKPLEAPRWPAARPSINLDVSRNKTNYLQAARGRNHVDTRFILKIWINLGPFGVFGSIGIEDNVSGREMSKSSNWEQMEIWELIVQIALYLRKYKYLKEIFC